MKIYFETLLPKLLKMSFKKQPGSKHDCFSFHPLSMKACLAFLLKAMNQNVAQKRKAFLSRENLIRRVLVDKIFINHLHLMQLPDSYIELSRDYIWKNLM